MGPHQPRAGESRPRRPGGLKEDFDAIPSYVRDYVRAKTGLTDMEELLRAALKLSHGFRREEYRQAIWMT